jgi:hypothetical protein
MKTRLSLIFAASVLTACPSSEKPTPAEPELGEVRFEQTATGVIFKGEGTELRVDLYGTTAGMLTFGGKTLDGYGALSGEEEATLRAIAGSNLVPGLMMIPLDLACEKQVEPQLMAALLMPWQTLLKYSISDRAESTARYAAASKCAYFSALDSKDTRPRPALPILANGDVYPRAYAIFPFDAAGAKPVRSIRGLATDENVYGPGGSLCRGACGPDCEPNNCGEPEQEWRCVKKDGRNTGDKVLWERYTCGEHPGCIEHDACFDHCNATFGPDDIESGICMRGCDLQAVSGYGANQGLEWALGNGPFTHEKNYDYSIGDPIPDDRECPTDVWLSANRSSGLAPFHSTISWEATDGDANERCYLDLGDLSPIVTIEPCGTSGSYDHIYAVPSDMRYSRDTYVVSLHRVGADTRSTTEVQATWLFTVSESSGLAPLETFFSWDGFRLVDKTLSCTVDFGDNTPPAVVEDCANKPGMAHTYANKGNYNATLTVRGEDRPVTKSLFIEVNDEAPPSKCDHIRNVRSWSGTASFNYTASAEDAAITVAHASNGTMNGTLTVAYENENAMSFHSRMPTGDLQISETSLWKRPGPNPRYQVTGRGDPIPPETSTDGGSNILLNFDLVNCRYNMHAQARVRSATTVGEDTYESVSWVFSIQSKWLPIPDGTALGETGAYTAHTEEWIIRQPELAEFSGMFNSDLPDLLGENGMGNAQISLDFAPSVE